MLKHSTTNYPTEGTNKPPTTYKWWVIKGKPAASSLKDNDDSDNNYASTRHYPVTFTKNDRRIFWSGMTKSPHQQYITGVAWQKLRSGHAPLRGPVSPINYTVAIPDTATTKCRRITTAAQGKQQQQCTTITTIQWQPWQRLLQHQHQHQRQHHQAESSLLATRIHISISIVQCLHHHCLANIFTATFTFLSFITITNVNFNTCVNTTTTTTTTNSNTISQQQHKHPRAQQQHQSPTTTHVW